MKAGCKWVTALTMAVTASVWAQQADEARAKKIVSGVCFVCHGAEGESSSEVFPRLAGQHWEYIAKQLENFKSGKRKSTAMADMVAKLTPGEMVALGKYFEKQNAPAQLKAFIERIGRLEEEKRALQYAPYTENQLKQFNTRERTNDNAIMHAIVSKMTPLEMAAVAEYLSGK